MTTLAKSAVSKEGFDSIKPWKISISPNISYEIGSVELKEFMWLAISLTNFEVSVALILQDCPIQDIVHEHNDLPKESTWQTPPFLQGFGEHVISTIKLNRKYLVYNIYLMWHTLNTRFHWRLKYFLEGNY